MGIGSLGPTLPPALRRHAGGLVALALLALAATCGGCRERANCNRQGGDSWRCSPDGRPERCAEGNVWRSHVYGPCRLSGQRCVLVPGIGASCVRADYDAAFPAADASAGDAPRGED